MSIRRSAKHVAKKRERQKEVKKALIEKRLNDRKQKRLDWEREKAFEREFNEKNKIGLSQQEVNEKLAHNMELLTALENELIEEEKNRSTGETSEKALAQLQAIEEFGKIQGDIIALEQEKANLIKEEKFTPEKAEEHAAKLDELNKKVDLLQKVREQNAL
jgi:hypothetical protein